MKKLIHTIIELVRSTFADIAENITIGIEEEDLGAVAKNMALLCALVGLAILLVYILVMLLLHNMVYVVIAGFILAAAYSALRKFLGIEEPEPEKILKPTLTDYDAILKTVKAALSQIAPQLSLAPIHSYTDISLAEEDAITPYGRVWRLGFGTLKKTAGTELDLDLCQRVIQAQVTRVLERENPSGFSQVRFPYGGRFHPIVIVDEVLQDDIELYVLAVIASEVYFKQKANWDRQGNSLVRGAEPDDTDF